MHNGKHIKKKEKARIQFSWIKVVASVTLVAAVIVAVYVVKTNLTYKELKDTYDDISDTYTTAKATPKPTEKPSTTAAAISTSAPNEDSPYFPIDVNFRSLLEKDNNVVGWIYSDKSKINYPVFQGSDNEYYLTNGMNGQYTGYGGIFLDAGNSGDFSNWNSILYGHHMQDGTFFASVYDYTKQEYYDEHPVLWLATPTQNYRADVYSCYITPADSSAYHFRFSDVNEFNNWLDKTIKNSLIDTEVMPNVNSRILTLSTCSYEYENARCVLHCILTPV